MFEWDDEKSEKCKAERGFDFSIVLEFDFETAMTLADDRRDYGEPRYRSLGEIDDKLFSVTWTPREGQIRIISVRRARSKERKQYE